MSYTVPFAIDLGPAETGLSLTATITTIAGAAVASGVTGWTEYPAGSGAYTGEYVSFADGTTYRIIWLSGATLKAGPVVVSPADATTPPVATVDLPALVIAMAAALGGAPVTLTSPVAASGNVEIVRGDDYVNADGRAIEWTNPAGTWPDLTGATIILTTAQGLRKTGSVITPTGPGQKVRVELTAAETTIAPGASEFDVQAVLANTRTATLVFGTLTVRADVTTP